MNLMAAKNDSVRNSVKCAFFRRVYYVSIEILGILLLKSPKSGYVLIEMSPSLVLLKIALISVTGITQLQT